MTKIYLIIYNLPKYSIKYIICDITINIKKFTIKKMRDLLNSGVYSQPVLKINRIQ